MIGRRRYREDRIGARHRSRVDVRRLFGHVHALQRRWDPLQHPFYVRWLSGRLTMAELGWYATEYEHLVIARAAASARVAESTAAPSRTDVADHAYEQGQHITLWHKFQDAVGTSRTDSPIGETVACARAWAGHPGRSREATLAVLYAIASAEPRLAERKRDALIRRYDMTHLRARAYFDVRIERDYEYARAARKHLEAALVPEIRDEVLASVDASLSGYWELLSALERSRQEGVRS